MKPSDNVAKAPNVIAEDGHLLVLNKPAGLLTQPSGTEQPSLEAQAKQWIKERDHKPGNVYLHAVHRIDKPVSGIVLFAKTSKALSRLQETMRSKKSRKIYLAMIEGSLPASEGILENYLVHDDFCAKVVHSKHPEAKLARLSYRVLKKTDSLSWVEIELETGRYHQIRIQFSHIGCPIVGDHKYGSRQHLPNPEAIALHHQRLEIEHPISHEMVTFEAPFPKEIGGRR